jgi:quercetin dioxygenase-like cupin family protein
MVIIIQKGMPVLQKSLVFGVLAATALALSAAAQSGGLKRTPLQTVDFPSGFQTVSVIAEIEPGTCAGRHTHPGPESTYIIEGEVTLKVDGKPDQVLKAGNSFQLPPGVVHDACNMTGRPDKALAVYIVEKGKPLASQVQ